MVPKIPKSEAIDGAISEYRISPSADGARITPEESKKLFEGFVQWRQRQ
jgi:hypothetical protein